MPTQITWKQVGPLAGSNLLSPAYVTTEAKKLVFTSGCVGTNPESGTLPEELDQQVRNSLENLKNVLKASGSSIDNVLKVLLFVADGSFAASVNKIYQEYFPSSPARSCIVVSFPDPKLKIELECIAETF